MGNSLSYSQEDHERAERGEMSIICKLVVDNDGKFAGLAPVHFVEPAKGRAEALELAKVLVAKVGKNFDSSQHNLKIPGVPEGAVDIGLHCSTHNAKFNGGALAKEQIEAIQACSDTFTLTVDLKDFKVLVGSPSNDAATGVIGYVGLLITADSLDEYNRAVAVYGGKMREGNIAHVSICGWDFKGFATTTEARASFGLVTVDGAKYPDGKPFYTANVFPALSKPQAQSQSEQKETTAKKKAHSALEEAEERPRKRIMISCESRRG